MTVKEAVLHYKLDRRRKWFAYLGVVVYNHNYTAPCSGCSEYSGGEAKNSNGCSECGYTGKRRNGCPVPASDKDGELIKTSDNDFTYGN